MATKKNEKVEEKLKKVEKNVRPLDEEDLDKVAGGVGSLEFEKKPR